MEVSLTDPNLPIQIQQEAESQGDLLGPWTAHQLRALLGTTPRELRARRQGQVILFKKP